MRIAGLLAMGLTVAWFALTGCSTEESPGSVASSAGAGGQDDASSKGGASAAGGGADAAQGGSAGAAAGAGGSSGATSTGGGSTGGASQQDAAAGETGPDSHDDAGFVCSPPAQPGSFHALSAVSKDRVDPVSMCEYRGKVVLLSNVAALCGFTPQLGTLASVQTAYASQGLVVLGFYSNQFGGQAGSDPQQETCEQNYGVNFELFETVNVNPPDEHPIFTWLKAQPGGAGDIAWNFEKFLISREGVLLGRWVSAVEPDGAEITAAIEAALVEAP